MGQCARSNQLLPITVMFSTTNTLVYFCYIALFSLHAIVVVFGEIEHFAISCLNVCAWSSDKFTVIEFCKETIIVSGINYP